MASAYLQMYQAGLNALEAQDEPPPAAVMELKLRILQLTEFIEKLQQSPGPWPDSSEFGPATSALSPKKGDCSHARQSVGSWRFPCKTHGLATVATQPSSINAAQESEF
jgi:hypothetical protein